MRQPYMIIDGKRYEQGTIFVVKHHNGIGFVELRTTFVYYDTERNRYCFLTPNRYNADCATIYPDIRFMDNLIRVDNKNGLSIDNVKKGIEKMNKSLIKK